jgi:hypothetical protein
MSQSASVPAQATGSETAKLPFWRAGYLLTPSFIEFAQTWRGRAVLFTAFALMATACSPRFAPICTIAAAVVAFAGAHRYWAILMTTAGFVAVRLFVGTPSTSAATTTASAVEGLDDRTTLLLVNSCTLLAFFAMSFLAIRWVRLRPASLLARRPTLCLVSAVLVLALLASWSWLHGLLKVVLWTLTLNLAFYCWYLGYALIDQKMRSASPMPAQLGVMRPAWSHGPTPIGKGMGYLRKVEAKTSHDLAVTQIKGVRLMAWCLALYVLQAGMNQTFQITLAIPQFDEVMTRFSAGAPYPIALSWASLVLAYFEAIISLSIFGHFYVAVARMAGFRLLRNTYRPFGATTLVEFWNRYYYYFKELLVEFFFLPTFLRYFKTRPKLRVAFATFMAAGVGNWLFHLIRDIGAVAEIGWWKYLVGFQTYAFYCFVLALGIIVSQFRKPRSYEGLLRGKIVPVVGIAAFFCLLQIFNDTSWSRPLPDHFRLFFYLFWL